MISDDFKRRLLAIVKEECADCQSKKKMADEAEAAGEGYLATMLHMAARDEESHARYAHDWLKEHGVPIPDADERMYQDVERMFHHR